MTSQRWKTAKYIGIFIAGILIGTAALGGYLFWRQELVRSDVTLISQLKAEGATPPDPNLVLAFPGAEGAGALSAGGRGGQVIEVTNLNDNGPGSLRAAIDTPGPRIVVFRVGGTIELQRPIYIQEPYLTIAGQTAPGGGITLRGTNNMDGEMLVLRDVHDVIIRFLRIRNGGAGEPGHGQINLAIDSGSYNIIVDHVSLSWTLDENIMIHRNIPDGEDHDTWPGISNITIQWSIISEGLYPHSTGIQIGGEAELDGWQGVHDITMHHNLFANNSHRNPGIGSLRTQVINNVVYNWSPRVGSTWRSVDVDWIGNYFKAGPMSDPNSILVHVAFPKDRPDQPWPKPSLFISGNVALPNHTDPDDDNWGMYRLHYVNLPLPEEFRRYEPLQTAGVPVTIQSASEAFQSVLIAAGTSARLTCDEGWVQNIDAIDQRLLDEVRQGTGPRTRPPAHENEVGGFPPVDPGTPCPDADHDGMPDSWEQAVGLDPGSDDSAGYDLDPKYTNIEVYLNGREFSPGSISVSQ